MKTTKLGLAIFAIIIAGATVISSCKKKTTTPDPTPAAADTDQSGASANNTAESVSSDVLHMGSEACDMGASGGNLSSYRAENTSILSCAVVTRDTINKLVTVTFSGGTCLDGKVRTGSLIYNYSGSPAGAKRYRDPGFTMNVTSNNYVVDGNTVTINNKTVTNTTPVGFNPLTTNETWSVSANISIGLSGGGTVSWTCNRVKTLLNTATTYSNSTTPIMWSLAKVGIMGTASGTRSNGETFSVNITNQLIRDFGACTISGKHPFIQGTLVYSPSGKSARTFDYGTGTCDLNATVTIDGVTYPFTLP
jgi:hypothetical protein